MDPSGNSLLNQLLFIIVLTAINAFFAASEMAFVSVNRKKIEALEEEGNKRAAKVLVLLERSDNFLATIQVAITLAGFLSSASAATSFTQYISSWLPNFPGAETVSMFIVTMILSYITLVFGELFPKQVALQMPEKITLWTAGTITWIQKIFKPFVSLLSASTGLLRRITPIDFSNEEEKFTRDEMKAILAESRLEGTLDPMELNMLEGVLSLDSKLAREVMVPRTDTEMVDIEDDSSEILETLMNSPFSRIPLYESEKDNVIGVIHMKNVMKAAREVGFENLDFKEIASEPLFVPSTIYIDDLLVEFRQKQTHLAILRDEYGGVEGIVTLEDLLEEIVGEIEDETDTGVIGDIRKIDDSTYYISGGLSIEKFNNYFGEELSSEEVDTIAGSIIYEIGYVPEDDERVAVRAGKYVLTTEQVENGRIRAVLVQVDEAHTLSTEYNLYDDQTSAYLPDASEGESSLDN